MSCSETLVVAAAEGTVIQRSCAFCLNPIATEQVRLCGKCRRRSYCSRECQAADWNGPKKDGTLTSISTPTATAIGQGHKNWCGLPYGEEGLDWAVKDIPGKGRGIIALRDFPAFHRIIVEGLQNVKDQGLESHPGFKFLASPPSGKACSGDTEFEKKFRFNAISSGVNGAVLGLRAGLINHACAANVEFGDDDEFGNLIVFSSRPISAGEEICGRYEPLADDFKLMEQSPFSDPHRSPEVSEPRSQIGISCPSTCVCKDPSLSAKVEEMQTLKATLEPLQGKGKHKEAVKNVGRIVELAEQARYPLHLMGDLYYLAYEICSARPQTADLGRSFIKKFMDSGSAGFHPKSKKIALYKLITDQKPDLGTLLSAYLSLKMGRR